MRFVGEMLKASVDKDSTPTEREEAEKGLAFHTFGFGAPTDDSGNPVEINATSDYAIIRGKAHPDRIQQHLSAFKRWDRAGDATIAEAKRIKALDKAGKLVAVLAPFLAMKPLKIPIESI